MKLETTPERRKQALEYPSLTAARVRALVRDVEALLGLLREIEQSGYSDRCEVGSVTCRYCLAYVDDDSPKGPQHDEDCRYVRMQEALADQGA
jgi:hypothetical protein